MYIEGLCNSDFKKGTPCNFNECPYNQTPQIKKDVGTLSNPLSGDTNQRGTNTQDDTKLQLERSASLAGATQSAESYFKLQREELEKEIEKLKTNFIPLNRREEYDNLSNTIQREKCQVKLQQLNKDEDVIEKAIKERINNLKNVFSTMSEHNLNLPNLQGICFNEFLILEKTLGLNSEEQKI
jgi:hypothetical protein